MKFHDIPRASPTWQQADAVRHRSAFRAIADHNALPIILHDVPARTVRELSDDTLVRLAQSPQFIGLKDGSGDVTRPMRLGPLLPAGFRLMSGDDATGLAFFVGGGDGCISLAALALIGDRRHFGLRDRGPLRKYRAASPE